MDEDAKEDDDEVENEAAETEDDGEDADAGVDDESAATISCRSEIAVGCRALCADLGV